MDAVMARATVRRGPRHVDVSAPVGTPVVALLASLRIDRLRDDVQIVLPDGTPLRPDAALGTPDLPTGSVITVSDQPTASEQRAFEERVRAAEGTPVGVLVVLALLVFGAEAATLLGPLSRGHRLSSDGVRWAVLGGGLVAAWAGSRLKRARGPLAAAWLPTAVAVPLLGAVAPDHSMAVAMALSVALTGGLLTAFLGWLASRDLGWAAATILWGSLWAFTCGGLVLGIPAVSLAVVWLVAAVMGLLLAPSLALQVPESQLVDVSQLVTLAPSAHAVEVPRPARITGRRVRRTLDGAGHVVDVVTLFCALVAVLAAPLVATRIAKDWTGRGCAAVVLCAVVVLLTHPRTSRMPVVRWTNRLAAAVIVVASGAVLLRHWPGEVAGVVGVLVVGGLGAVAVALVSTRDPRPVVLSRLADILQGLATIIIFVSAVMASGLWHLLVQWGE